MAELLKGKALFPGNDCILNNKTSNAAVTILSNSLVFFFSNDFSVSGEMFLS